MRDLRLHSLLFVAAVLFAITSCSAVFAQALPAITYPTGGKAVVIPGVLGPAPVAQQTIVNAANDARVINPLRAVVGVKDVDIAASRLVTAANIARAVGSIAKAASVVGAVALVAENARCTFGSEGWRCDWGQAKQLRDAWCEHATSPTAACRPTPEALAIDVYLPRHWLGYPKQYTSLACVSTANPLLMNCTFTGVKAYYNNIWNNVGNHTVEAWRRNSEMCPEGSDPLGVGALCTTDPAVWPATSPERVAEQVLPHVKTSPADTLRDLLPGLQPGQRIETGPIQLTGPASVQQPATTTTTTSPSGVPAVRTEQVTNHITYAGDTMTWNNVTVINNPDGSTETKEEAPKPEEKPECEKNPESLLCKELDIPEAPELPEREDPVDYQPDAGWGSAGTSCPSPRSLSIQGQSMVLDNTLTCDFLAGIRPAVIAAFGCVGALIFIGGLRQ